MIDKGDKVIIKDNLIKVLNKLDMCYDEEAFRELIGTEQKVYSIWESGNQKYATIDLCVETPIQCLEIK